ncbi:damage-inducible protein DinB [Massilia sp. RP-1-19]|uniref:Damage-inducible protein DinB n=1 Tax=Massilia polaris TaxID=2728846 RepID=A0A848HFH2_9BURK|nr:DinB family protein [Massilia polaris]NML60606.1 damage-inducible protein DinB [Massilia polaris]
MSMCEHARLMAQYNEWMNTRLYGAALTLPADAVLADKGAFFGSLYGTLSHIVLGDTIWLKRFSMHPAAHASLDPVRAMAAPASYDEREGNLEALRERRIALDKIIGEWAAELAQADFGHVLKYNNVKGMPFSRPFSGLVTHFFNHQTHHRGQATALLSQAGVDMGTTDLLMLVPEA